MEMSGRRVWVLEGGRGLPKHTPTAPKLARRGWPVNTSELTPRSLHISGKGGSNLQGKMDGPRKSNKGIIIV